MAESAPCVPAPAVAMIGLDHHRCPVGLRESLARAAADPAALAAALLALPGCSEAVVLATCNRCELYLGGAPDLASVAALLADRAGLEEAVLVERAYRRTGIPAAQHLFRVAAGLESLVLGEAEIAGQVRRAYEEARTAGRAGTILHPLFQRALAVGKEVRSDTALGRHRRSVASVAVDLAAQVHGDLAGCAALVVGAGETAELVVTHLKAAGVARLTVCNRSPERAAALAAAHGAASVPWESLAAVLAEADIVVASTAAPHPVIGAAMVRAAVQKRATPMVLIDLAVPRDVDPQAAGIDDAYLYNLDHLERVVAANLALRREEVAAAEALVAAAVQAWLAEHRPGRGAFMARVAGHLRGVVAAEEARLAGRLGEGVPRDELRYGLERVGNKLLHPVLAWLRAHPEDPEAERRVAEMLGMEDGGGAQRKADDGKAD